MEKILAFFISGVFSFRSFGGGGKFKRIMLQQGPY